MPPPIVYLSEADVEQTLTIAEAVDLAEKGMRADAAGNVAGDKFYMPVGEDGFIKPFSGYLADEEYAYVKTFSFFPDNPQRFDAPTTSSLVLLFDARSGLPVCMMEAGWVTALKTGASTIVTTSMLARRDSENAVIFGAGQQGRMHLRALAHRFDLKQVWLIDALPEVAQRTAAELQAELEITIDAVSLDERERVVRQSDIAITVTTGNQPLIERAWLKPGAFVARMGSYQEIALDVVTDSDKLIVDSWKYVSPRIPEIKELIAAERLSKSDIYAEWPDVVAGRKPGRESPDEVIVYIALGIWGEYAAILPEVYRRAKKLGLGQVLGKQE